MYKYLSRCYDIFMRDVNYDAWTKRLVACIGDRKKGVDCGCGSGMITYRLKKLGYDVVGMDVSREMLERAAANFAEVGEKITLVCMDSEKLRLARPVDFITAVCDVVNYMKHPQRFFERAYASLNENGVLLFDISSEYKLKNELAGNVFTDSTDEYTYIWSNVLSAKCDKVEMNLTFFHKIGENNYQKTEEMQTQYVYSQENIVNMLTNAGFTGITVSGKNGREVTEEDQRLYFAAYKQE